MSAAFGEAMRRVRMDTGLSQASLARRVSASQSYVSKVENGLEQASPEFAKVCDEALEAGGALAALVPARRPPRLGADDVEAWELADVLTATTLSSRTLEQMRRAVFGYAGTYPQATPDELLLPVHRQLRRLRQALAQPQPVVVRRQAVQLAGVLAGVAGNLALDVHRDAQAEGYFDVAAMAGEEAEDGDLIAWALATRSLVPFFAGRPADAVELLDHAAVVAQRSSSPRRQAWVAALLARASAAAGDAKTALSQLDAAGAALAVASPPEGNDFFDEPRLVGFAGSTLLLLHRAGEASELLVDSVKRRPAGDAKGRALATLDLASCRLVEDHPDEATRLVEESLRIARGGVVAPIISRIQDVQADMMAVDPTSAAQVGQLLRDATRAEGQE